MKGPVRRKTDFEERHPGIREKIEGGLREGKALTTIAKDHGLTYPQLTAFIARDAQLGGDLRLLRRQQAELVEKQRLDWVRAVIALTTENIALARQCDDPTGRLRFTVAARCANQMLNELVKHKEEIVEVRQGMIAEISEAWTALQQEAKRRGLDLTAVSHQQTTTIAQTKVPDELAPLLAEENHNGQN